MSDTKWVRERLEASWDDGFEYTAGVANDEIPALCDEVDALRIALAAAEARADDADKRATYYQDFHGRLAEWRGVEVAELCQRCGGLGQAGYSDTSTWHGGMGGQAMTSDVCDKCWGSGIAKRPGADLRAMGARIKAAEARAERLAHIIRLAREVIESGTMTSGGLLITSRRYDNLVAEIKCAQEDGDLGGDA